MIQSIEQEGYDVYMTRHGPIIACLAEQRLSGETALGYTETGDPCDAIRDLTRQLTMDESSACPGTRRHA